MWYIIYSKTPHYCAKYRNECSVQDMTFFTITCGLEPASMHLNVKKSLIHTIHFKHWWPQCITTHLHIFKDVIHFEISGDHLHEHAPKGHVFNP